VLDPLGAYWVLDPLGACSYNTGPGDPLMATLSGAA